MTIADVFGHAFLKQLAPLEDKAANVAAAEDVGVMMLTDLTPKEHTEEAKANETPVETLDAIAYKTLDAEDRKAFQHSHCEETPGFKRGTPPGMMEDSACRESMQSSTFTVG